MFTIIFPDDQIFFLHWSNPNFDLIVFKLFICSKFSGLKIIYTLWGAFEKFWVYMNCKPWTLKCFISDIHIQGVPVFLQPLNNRSLQNLHDPFRQSTRSTVHCVNWIFRIRPSTVKFRLTSWPRAPLAAFLPACCFHRVLHAFFGLFLVAEIMADSLLAAKFLNKVNHVPTSFTQQLILTISWTCGFSSSFLTRAPSSFCCQSVRGITNSDVLTWVLWPNQSSPPPRQISFVFATLVCFRLSNTCTKKNNRINTKTWIFYSVRDRKTNRTNLEMFLCSNS